MAGKGALYAGMNYSTKVEPVDFGGLALGFAKISEDKRLEAEKKQKEREDFQVQMNTLYGEEIYTAFDNTGIDNLDIIGGKLKDGIVAHSETLNKMFAEGKISRPELAARMNKLKSQSAKYSGFITQLGDYAQKVTDLGSDASQATRLILDRMDELTKNATPVVDADGNISFLSKSGEVITKTPFSQLDKIMDFRKQVDETSIIRDMVATEGELSKIFEGDKIKKTYLEDGKLRKEHKDLLKNYTRTLDDTDLYDIAVRAGIDVKLDPKELLKIDNLDDVRNKVDEHLENLALGEYGRRDSVDEVEYDKTMSVLNVNKERLAKAKKENKTHVKNTLPPSGNKNARDQYVFLTEERPSVIDLQGFTKELNGTPKDNKNYGWMNDSKKLETARVASYETDNQGNHYITISYKVPIVDKKSEEEDKGIPGVVATGGNQKTQYELKTAEMIITDPSLIGQVRAKFDLETEASMFNTVTPTTQSATTSNVVGGNAR